MVSFEKINRMIKLIQNAWPKPYIDMNTAQKKKSLKMIFFKLMDNDVFGKPMENVRKHGDIKLAKTEKRRNYLAFKTKSSYYKVFHKYLLAMEIKETCD